MIVAKELTLMRAGRVLFAATDFALHAGWRVGLTGSNGAGKSSLFAALRGDVGIDAGLLERPSGWVVAWMAQEVAASPQPAIEFVLDGDAEWRQLDSQLQMEAAGHQLAELFARYEAINGYAARSRAAQLLAGLGFTEAAQQRPVSDFSGGWRMRLSLARTLMCRSDLLLLDEPTNHLDLDAILWLEDWLNRYPGTLLVVSHDRDFLDAVVSQVLHIEQQTLTHYRGNYSTFERTRAERLAQQAQLHARQQAQAAHLMAFVERFRAKATKARQAQSRLKALERMTLTAPAMADSQLEIRFAAPARLPTPLLRLDDGLLGYDGNPVLSKVNLTLAPGARLALLGPNGAGKSTLIRSLVGELPLQSGTLMASEHTRIGYFAQHQVDHLDAQASPLLLLQRLSPQQDELTLRNFLGGFGFQGERVLSTIAPFSGGEKARLALALIVWQKPNLLLLDEPTNHLDLELRHALMLALQQFAGALVLVSHDRNLVSLTCDELLLVADGQVQPFAGDMSAYADWLRQWRARQRLEATPTAPAPAVAAPAKADSSRRAVRSADVRALQQRSERAEADMQTAQAALDALVVRMSAPDLYAADASTSLQALLAEQQQWQARLAAAEQAWLSASEALEDLLGQ